MVNSTVEVVVKLLDSEFVILLTRYLTPVILAFVNAMSLPAVMFPVDDIVVNAPSAGVILPMTVLFKLLIVSELNVQIR